MKCAFCGTEDMDPIVLVPFWQPDGGVEAFACLSCSKQEGLYCEKHDKPHMGFTDKTTACLYCIEELVKQEGHWAHEVATAVRNAVGPSGQEDLSEAAEVAAMITGGDEDIAILRFVVSRAKRNNLSIDDVVKRVMEERSASFILGEGL